MKLKDITTPKLTQVMQSYNLNPATVRKLYVIIQSIFKRGMEQGFLRDNPCHNVILPKNKEQHKVMALTEDELKQAEVEIQKITDAKVEEIDKILADKEKEIKTI